jgi:hypothetical protein
MIVCCCSLGGTIIKGGRIVLGAHTSFGALSLTDGYVEQNSFVQVVGGGTGTAGVSVTGGGVWVSVGFDLSCVAFNFPGIAISVSDRGSMRFNTSGSYVWGADTVGLFYGISVEAASSFLYPFGPTLTPTIPGASIGEVRVNGVIHRYTDAFMDATNGAVYGPTT